jgi:hypothetical protein
MLKEAHVALLRAALSEERDEDRIEAIRLDLRRYALWLEDAVLDGKLATDEETCLNLAATLFEFVGRLSASLPAPTIFEPPLSDLISSSLLGSLTAYQAVSSLIARRMVQSLSSVSASSTTAALHKAVGLIILDFLARGFGRCFSRAVALPSQLPSAIEELRRRDAANSQYLALDRAAALGFACGLAAVGMLTGSPDLVGLAAQRLDSIRDAAKASEDADRYWLADRIRRVALNMRLASTERILRDAEIPEQYRRALARDGFFEFWAPQLEAIEKGLLTVSDPPNLVVSIPTGSGKTLIAELAILTAFKQDQPLWALYVTPTRALVNQVSSDLRRRLESAGIKVRTVLAGAEQGGILSDELDLLTVPRSVTVTTPEKLDAYYRNAKELFDTCALAVFDEVHKLSDTTRGPLIESLVIRFLTLQPKTRLILLSGVLSNPDDLTTWLGPERAQSVTAERRPTRQVRALAVRHDLTPQDPTTRRTRTTRSVDYSGGLLLVHEADDLRGDLHVQLPAMFSGHFTEVLQQRVWRQDRKASHSSRNDHAIAIAELLARTPGTVLVFVQNPTQAESCCRRLSFAAGPDFQSDREKIARYLASDLGEDHLLVASCRRGVAFHHARLPASVQRALEFGLQRGYLKVVFSTPTLREGLNTAATYVILAGHTYYDEARDSMVDIAESDFENLAGRAGRPSRETEGVVVLIPDRLAFARWAGNKYLLTGIEALRARSQLKNLALSLARAGGDLRSLPPGDQSILLGLTAADLDQASGFTAFFERSLWSVQEDNIRAPAIAAALATRAFTQVQQSLGPERLKLAARTGLSLTSAEALMDQLYAQASLFSFNSHASRDELLAVLLESSLHLPEIRQNYLAKDLPWQAHLNPLLQWVSAQPYQSVLAAALETGALPPSSTIGTAVKYCADMSTWLSWSFGAAYLILQSAVDPMHPQAASLPLLVKYGVPNAVAAYLSLMGIGDRSAAMTLATRFLETGKPPSFADVSEWMDGIDEEIDKAFPDMDIRNELLRHQLLGGRRPSLEYITATLKLSRDVLPGNVSSLTPQQYWLDAHDEHGSVGSIPYTSAVSDFVGPRPETVVCVVTGTPTDRTVPVALVRLAPLTPT